MTTDIQQTNVILRRSGSVQLWWGGGLGVIFEAFIDQLIPNAKTPGVLDALVSTKSCFRTCFQKSCDVG